VTAGTSADGEDVRQIEGRVNPAKSAYKRLAANCGGHKLDFWIMKTTCSIFAETEADRRGGFTLTELAVVFAAVALLALVCLPALASTKGESRIAQCASNLKQYCLALQLFGNENSDKLPVNGGDINWAWDLSWSTGNSVTQYVSFRKFYCPGTAVRFSDQDNANLWNFYPGFIHVSGYVPMLSGSRITATNQNPTLTPQRILSGSVYLPAPAAAGRVLVADGTVSVSSSDNQAGFRAGAKYNFVTVYGGYPVPSISPHLNGFAPAGGNVGMLDGHVQWRWFSDMDQHGIPGPPGFWW
jgi:prepilin-type processing-associated H-X9-DG protein